MSHAIVEESAKQIVELSVEDVAVEYAVAESFMRERVAEICTGHAAQMIWILEHSHVYTAGQRVTREEIQEVVCKVHPVLVYESERGGQMAYHGPGQRIIYFMLNMTSIYGSGNTDIRRFVHDVEDVAILTLRNIGVNAFRVDGLTGVWTQTTAQNQTSIACEIKKIAALGLKFKKTVSYYGLSINISTDMSYYSNIAPCGLSSSTVTSLEKLGIIISITEFDLALISAISHIFPNITLKPV